jgi:hypothetical protein
MVIILEAVLKSLERLRVPQGVDVLEDGERSHTAVQCVEVRVRGVVSDELFAELGHRERPGVLEACYELAIGSEEQVHAFLLEVVFGELIHCTKYIGTVNGCQAKSADEGHQLWKMTLP